MYIYKICDKIYYLPNYCKKVAICFVKIVSDNYLNLQKENDNTENVNKTI